MCQEERILIMSIFTLFRIFKSQALIRDVCFSSWNETKSNEATKQQQQQVQHSIFQLFVEHMWILFFFCLYFFLRLILSSISSTNKTHNSAVVYCYCRFGCFLVFSFRWFSILRLWDKVWRNYLATLKYAYTFATNTQTHTHKRTNEQAHTHTYTLDALFDFWLFEALELLLLRLRDNNIKTNDNNDVVWPTFARLFRHLVRSNTEIDSR